MIRRIFFLAAALLGGFLLPAEAQQINTSGAASSGVTSANVQNQAASCAADTGAADVYVVTLSPAPSAYASLQRFCFKAVNANATTTPTLNVNGLGAKTITKNGGAALAVNDIKAGQVVDVEYDGTNLQMQSTLGNAASGGSFAIGGTTVTSPNGTADAYNTYAGSQFNAFGSNIGINQAFPLNTTYYIYGDSTSRTLSPNNGDSAPPSGQNGLSGWAGQVINTVGTGASQDWAVDGDQCEDDTVRAFFHIQDYWTANNATSQVQPARVIEACGVNDANFQGNSTYRTTITRPSLYALLTATALNANNMTYGQAAGCVKTGSWSTDNTTFLTAASPVVTLSGIAEVSQTNGDTIACPIVTTATSPVGVVWYGMKDSNLGTFSLSSSAGACTDVVTGGTTINAFGGTSIATHNGATVTIGAALCPLTAGSYTMTATINTGSSGATKKVWILGMGAMPAMPDGISTLSPVSVTGVIRARTDTNSAQTDAYDAEKMNAAARLLTAYNFPIAFMPNHTYTVANLPATPITGAVADINDSTTGCSVGGATLVMARCRYNGASWDAQLGGPKPINMPTTSGFYTDGLHPARPLHALLYRQYAPFQSGRSSNSTTQLNFSVYGANGSSVPGVSLTATAASSASGELACGDAVAMGDTNCKLDMRQGTLRLSILDMYADDGSTINWQEGGQNKFLFGCSTCRFGLTSGSGVSGESVTFDLSAAGIFGVSTSSAANHDGMISAKGFLSPNVVHQTAKTAAITTSTLCAAATGGCNVAGQYHISATIINTGTACTNITAGSVGLNLTWTDSNGTTHTTVTVPLFTQASSTATAATMPFVANNLSAFASADFNISTNGTIVQYATTYTACTTGTGTYQLDISINKVQ